MDSWFGQLAWPVRHEWGVEGAERAARDSDVVVIVDVLRFTTMVTTAVANGYWIRACGDEAEIGEAVDRWGDIKGGKNTRFSLSPLDYSEQIDEPLTVAVASPNGARCSRAAGGSTVLAGAIVNARAVAMQLTKAVGDGCKVTVVSCGEVAHHGSGRLRFAIEDYLGAGAILAAVKGPKSPEAECCVGAFLSIKDRLEEVLLTCGSGIELIDKGRIDDVRYAARLDSAPVIAAMMKGGDQDGVFVLWSDSRVDSGSHGSTIR